MPRDDRRYANVDSAENNCPTGRKRALGPCNLVKREAWRREIETRENRRAISMGKEPIIS